jgi:hypothetical protein
MVPMHALRLKRLFPPIQNQNPKFKNATDGNQPTIWNVWIKGFDEENLF